MYNVMERVSSILGLYLGEEFYTCDDILINEHESGIPNFNIITDGPFKIEKNGITYDNNYSGRIYLDGLLVRIIRGGIEIQKYPNEYPWW